MNILEVDKVCKNFLIPYERSNSIKESILQIFQKKKYHNFKALNGLSFSLNKGDWLGIVGANGSGKSTLLKIIAGIYKPDKGKVIIRGTLIPFLELGVGFNPELSARDNIYLNGVLLGMTIREVEKKFDTIVDFAEVRQFLDTKLKNFSSGMQVRLAFSIAIQNNSDIYLLDEVLAVGDIGFQKKCREIFQQFKKENKTVILVSHDLASINRFCEKTLWVEKGKAHLTGESKKVTDKYWKSIFPDLTKKKKK